MDSAIFLQINYAGTGFTYDVTGNVISGTITQISLVTTFPLEISDIQISVAAFRAFVDSGNTQGFLASILSRDDTISHPGDGGLQDAFNGFAGNDSIDGDAGNDTLRGGTGNDTLIGGLDVDSLIGGTGNDRYFVDNSGDIVDETDGNGIDTVVVETGFYNLFANGRGNIENIVVATSSSVLANDLNNNIVGSGFGDTLSGGLGNDTIDGGGGADNISGGIGNDKLIGGDGNDTLVGNIGRDTLIGGVGDDTYTIDDEESVIETLAGSLGGKDFVQYSGTRGTYTLGANLENLLLISGTTGTGNGLNNEVTGNAFGNRLAGLAGSDTLTGNLGNDTLDGGGGADSLIGGSDSDVYIIDNAFDTVEELAADPGIDTIKSSVTFSLDVAAGQVIGDVEALFLTGMAAINATGNALANTLVGNAAKNLILGLGGDDTLNGGGGDTLEGGTGNDTYVMGAKLVQIGEFGGDLGDAIVAAFSVDLTSAQFADIEFVTLTGSAGLNATGNDARNRLAGNAGANKLMGAGASDTLEGGNGNDTLDGGTDDDLMLGGAGNDTYIVDSDQDAIKGEIAGGGTDTIFSTVVDLTIVDGLEHLVLLAGADNGRGNSGNNRMTGNDAENILVGGDGNDTLLGAGGADLLDGGTGKDAMSGGLGNDTYGADDGDTITESVGGAAGGVDDVIYVGTKGHTLAANVENLILAAASGDSFGTGNSLNNTITGNDGSNRLLGMAGNDTLLGGDLTIINNDIRNTLDGGVGADSMVGGGSFNDYFVDNIKDVVDTFKSGFAFDTIHSSVSFDLGENGVTVLGELEYLVLTGTKAINGTGNGIDNIITGNGAANLIDGGRGADELAGGGGNDRLFGGDDGDSLNGGAGADTMEGGGGEDTYVVDNAKDVIRELAGPELDVVLASINYTLPDNFEFLDLIGNATIATGNAVDNVIGANILSSKLFGLGGSDTLVGQDGADTLDGGIGNDTMAGRKGSDVYRVDSAGDVVDESLGDGIDTVIATVSYSLSAVTAADIENLTLATGAGNIDGSGNGQNNRIIGNEGQNDLDGEDGNDTILGGANGDFLVGGAGNDSLDGGAGDDFFFGDIGDDMMAGGTGRDIFFYSTVLDGHDLIRGFDGNPAGNQDVLDLEDLFNDLGVGTEAERAARVQITDRGANVDVRVDTDGNGSFDLFVATLQTSDAITVSGDLSLGG